MKIFVKALKGTQFEIEVNLEDTIADVKKNIENVQGQDVYPAARQMIFHQGKVLKDGTTLEDNKVSENSSIFIMLSKVTDQKRTAPPPPPVAEPIPVVAPIPVAPRTPATGDLLGLYSDPEHLNSGIPVPPEVPPRVAAPPPPPVADSMPGNPYLPRGPNANPLNIFPHERQEDVIRSPVLSFTRSEVAAIERLMGMGFNESLVIDVFLAYDKNEEMAADYLLDHINEFQ